MKKYLIILLICFCFSCNKEINLEGQWKLYGEGKGHEISFQDNTYKEVKWNGDLINEFTGRYFINKNPKRDALTLSLIPDLQYSEGDTIILPCKYLDIIEHSDTALTIQLPTKWIGKSGQTNKVNQILVYSKIK